MMVGETQLRGLFETVAACAAGQHGIRDVEAHFRGGTESLTRFANNAIHQNVSETSQGLSVRLVIGKRTARASTNRLDAEGIAQCVEQAAALTRVMAPDEELLPMYEPPTGLVYPEVQRFDADTADCRPEVRARAVAEAIRVVESEGQTAAGIYSTENAIEAVWNSRGVFAVHRETMARFSITAMAADSSGWAKASSVRCGDLDPVGLAKSAALKAKLSAGPRELPPGACTVILEPSAVLDFVGQIMADFSATSLADQRSFLTERIGKQIFHPTIAIRDDVGHPLQSGAPFDGEGVPRSVVQLVESGVPKAVVYSRGSAAKAGSGCTPTGHGIEIPNDSGETPENLVIDGGNATVDDMIASTGRGILVTRLWYIREVDPYEKIMTGMTRDGTFLVEDGRVVCGVRNFRFNQSVIEALANVQMLGEPVRATGEEAFDMVVPAMKIGGFGFTEVTKF
jgi:PmbA protein